MSRRDKTRYWRRVRCEKCPRRCRYRDFRAGGPGFAEVYAYLTAEIERGGSRYLYKRRGTILGIMHAHKRELWGRVTEECDGDMMEST